MNKKFWLASIVAYVVYMALGFLIYENLMAVFYGEVMDGIAREESFILPYFFRNAIIVLVMAYMYPKGYSGKTPWLEGLAFGVLVALLIVGANAFDLFAMLPIMAMDIVLLFIPEFISLIILGVIIGAIYGKIEK